MTSQLASLTIGLVLFNCSGAAAPDGGTTGGGDACVDLTTELATCSTSAEYSVYAPSPLAHGLTTGAALEATWSAADAAHLRLSFDGGAPTAVPVDVDPTPLNAVVSDGEAVRVTATDESLLVTRPDGALLFAVQTTTTYSGGAELPVIAGLGAAMTAQPSCEIVHEYSGFCAPAIVRVSSIEVSTDSGPVLVGPRESAAVVGEEGTFRVHNLLLTEARHPGGGSCAHCAIAFASIARVGFVRTE